MQAVIVRTNRTIVFFVNFSYFYCWTTVIMRMHEILRFDDRQCILISFCICSVASDGWCRRNVIDFTSEFGTPCFTWNGKLWRQCHWKLTLQGNRLHRRVCLSEPSIVQSFPPICGAGLLQKRFLSWIPPPQSASQGSHGDHRLYPPLTV